MNRIPVYVVTGFLSTGKTLILNNFIVNRKKTITSFYCEEGMSSNLSSSHKLNITPEINDTQLGDMAIAIKDIIKADKPKELWIEWNGMVPFRILEKLFCRTTLANYTEIAKVIYVTTPDYVLNLMGKTGEANLSQLGNADLAIVVGDKYGNNYKASEQKLKRFHPHLKIFNCDNLKNFDQSDSTAINNLSWFDENTTIQHVNSLLKPGPDKLNRVLWLALIISSLAYFWVYTEGGLPNIPDIPKVLSIFSGIILQAFPFLTIGIIISSIVQIYIPAGAIERALSGNPIKATFFALLGGFMFPICDCATIPIFRSLLIRRIPIFIGLVFMLSSPIINPVVILSTYYAFSGNMHFVLGRLGLGILGAIIIALTFVKYQSLTTYSLKNLDSITFQTTYLRSSLNRYSNSKLGNFFVNTQNEFYRTGIYLVFGAFISACFQVYLTPLFNHSFELSSMIISILIMMFVAYVLSLCSTSDAMIGRSLGTILPLPSVMGFLLFGAILDVKNTLILLSFFPGKFVLRLIITSIIVVLTLSLLFAKFFNLL